MLPQSAVFTSTTSATSPSGGDVLVLSSGLKRVLVPVPASYGELVTLTKDTFNFDTDALVFETDDLNICRGSSVEIHKSSWEAVRSVVGTVSVVVVKGDAATSSRRIRVSTSIQQGLNEQDVKPMSTSSRVSVSSRVLTEKQITLKEEQENVLPSSLDGDVETQVEDELFGETAEEEEEEDILLSPVKGKGRARNRILSDDEDELNEPATSTLSVKHTVNRFVSPRPSAASARPTPRDVDDMFSPARPVRSKKAPVMSNDSSEENDENLAPPRIRLSAARRVTPIAFEEEDEIDENTAPSPLRQSIARSEARISTSTNPEVRSVKKTPHKTNNYAAQDEVSPSPKPKFRPARSPQPTASGSSSGHAPVQRSALRQSTLNFDAEESQKSRKVEPIAPLREAEPLPDEKILVTIAHPDSQQESKFKIKGKHTVEKILKPACQAFGLDMNYARLILEEEVDGIEMSSECDRHQTMISAGVRNNSYLVIVMDEEAEEEDE
ncbi:unnamed protein product [Peniophora sp. CBMAI 1063]|nr:unnamed protein product [Peniophora sp. CBMAI 1063]